MQGRTNEPRSGSVGAVCDTTAPMRERATAIPSRAVRLLCSALVVLAVGCASNPPHVDPIVYERAESCPEQIEHNLRVSAFATVIRASALNRSQEQSRFSEDAHQRRVVISAAPLRAQAGKQISWARLSLRTLGGTFTGWTRLKTDHALIEADTRKPPSRRSARGAKWESATVSYSAGQLIITRTALARSSLAGAVVLDVSLVPGGIPVDDTVLHVPRLWESHAQPLPADDLTIELLPVRHAPGYEGIEALVNLEYIIRDAREQREWTCTAETHITLVDREAVRPPYWDLGTSKLNEGRSYWLALYEPSIGVLRAMFDSPASANAFASWLRKSGAATAGRYQLGLFDGRKPKALRPFVPVDRTLLDTFRPLTPAEASLLRAGPLGEP